MSSMTGKFSGYVLALISLALSFVCVVLGKGTILSAAPTLLGLTVITALYHVNVTQDTNAMRQERFYLVSALLILCLGQVISVIILLNGWQDSPLALIPYLGIAIPCFILAFSFLKR